jgi:hypothetical protein
MSGSTGASFIVMVVLVTVIHAFVAAQKGVDARDEREHDGEAPARAGSRLNRTAMGLARA